MPETLQSLAELECGALDLGESIGALRGRINVDDLVVREIPVLSLEQEIPETNVGDVEERVSVVKPVSASSSHASMHSCRGHSR